MQIVQLDCKDFPLHKIDLYLNIEKINQYIK